MPRNRLLTLPAILRLTAARKPRRQVETEKILTHAIPELDRLARKDTWAILSGVDAEQVMLRLNRIYPLALERYTISVADQSQSFVKSRAEEGYGVDK